MAQITNIPITTFEGEDTRGEYIIRCTFPHIRTTKTFKDRDYPRCDSKNFHVKWNPKTADAKVFCAMCHNELFTYHLNMVGEGNNGNNTISAGPISDNGGSTHSDDGNTPMEGAKEVQPELSPDTNERNTNI